MRTMKSKIPNKKIETEETTRVKTNRVVFCHFLLLFHSVIHSNFLTKKSVYIDDDGSVIRHIDRQFYYKV
jgi:hypothetical protein